MPVERYAFLGNAAGELLPTDDLAVRLSEGRRIFNAVEDLRDAFGAMRGLARADVQEILESGISNNRVVYLVLRASSLWFDGHSAKICAAPITRAATNGPTVLSIGDRLALPAMPRNWAM